MDKHQLEKRMLMLPYTNVEKDACIRAVVAKIETRIAGKRGAAETRVRIDAFLQKLYNRPKATPPVSPDIRTYRWRIRAALALAKEAGAYFDDNLRTWERGVYRHTKALDYIPPYLSKAAPYHDLGGAGMALVAVTRRTCYAKSSDWGPSEVTTHFLVGRNESGTYWTHPVPMRCVSLPEALEWLWNGRAMDIIQRQGDVALVRGGGPKLPSRLPDGHIVDAANGQIIHQSHAPLRLPGPGERIVVSQRASARSASATRD